MTPAYRIGFLLWPNLTQLDMTGPAQVLHRMPGAELFYVWKTLDPVPSDCGPVAAANDDAGRLPAARHDLRPGGAPVASVMRDAEVLDWLRAQAAGAKLITSVCTGSLILAAAGLLEGYRAGCYWASGDALALFGATFVKERVVVDRNRITAGGVSSGIDFAFRIIEQLHGRDVAESVQLSIEYNPEPLGGGTPATARPKSSSACRG